MKMPLSLWVVQFLLLSLVGGCVGRSFYPLPSKILRAIEEGADFIEADILSSKDGHLVCFHDLILDLMTDIAARKEFADRKRTYKFEYANVTFTGLLIVTSVHPLQHQRYW
ncbi:hypothetical protein MKX03_012096, partial [Papaver bracteatum]